MKKQLVIILAAACALSSQVSATPFFEYLINLKNSAIQNEYKSKDIKDNKFVVTDEYNGEFFTATFNQEPDETSFKLSDLTLNRLNYAAGISEGDSISFPKEGKIIFDLLDEMFLTVIKHHSTQQIYTEAISKILQNEVDSKDACEKIDYRVYPSLDDQGNQIIDCVYICEEPDDDFGDHFWDDDYDDDYDDDDDDNDFPDDDFPDDDYSDSDLVSIFGKIIITNDNAYFLIMSTPELSPCEEQRVQDFFSSFKILEIR